MSRRIGLLLMAGALFLVLLSGVALATSFALESFQCTDVPCYGTNAHERIRERQGSGKHDDIHARGGLDELRADRWGNDTDVLRGQKRDDFLNSKDGDGRDVVICGPGNDVYNVDPGDSVTDGCEQLFVGR